MPGRMRMQPDDLKPINPYNTMVNVGRQPRAKRMANRHTQKKSFADKVVYVSIAAVTLFTIIALVFHYIDKVDLSDTLITAWFSFWGVEIIALATIKTSKVKHGYEKEDTKGVGTQKAGRPKQQPDDSTGNG
jgi:hypothetical protein